MNMFNTSRFGKIPVDESQAIVFPDGLLGFPGAHRFILLETTENSIFYWLQSLDDPSLAFVVIDPLLLVPDYMSRLELYEWDREFFSPCDPAALQAMAIVTFPEEGEEGATANLQGPLLVREQDRHGRQVILADSDAWLRIPVFRQGGETGQTS